MLVWGSATEKSHHFHTDIALPQTLPLHAIEHQLHAIRQQHLGHRLGRMLVRLGRMLVRPGSMSVVLHGLAGNTLQDHSCTQYRSIYTRIGYLDWKGLGGVAQIIRKLLQN